MKIQKVFHWIDFFQIKMSKSLQITSVFLQKKIVFLICSDVKTKRIKSTLLKESGHLFRNVDESSI